jgi:hypothetical protein
MTSSGSKVVKFPSASQLPCDPFMITRTQAIAMLGGRRDLVARLIYWSSDRWPKKWIHIVYAGGMGQDTLIDFESLKECYRQRLRFGNEPPPLPREDHSRKKETCR